MKRIIAILLAMVMVFALGFSALADEEPVAAEEPILIAPSPADMEGKTVILHTNDVHGAVEGYASVAALKSEYEDRGADVVLVDAGDFSQGTTYVSTAKGATAVSMMNAVGYDFATLGNHEFDYGVDQLMENLSTADFKVLCANIFGADGKLLFDANTVYTTASGLKIGFFGLDTPEAQTKVNPSLIKGLKVLATDELFACAQAQVDALAEADLVVCLGHLGFDKESVGNRSLDLLEKVNGIDLFIDAHSHVTIDDIKAVTNEDCIVNGTKLTSTGISLAYIGVVVIDNETKAIESCELVPVNEESAQDAGVAAAAKVIVDRVTAEYGQVFATSEVSLCGIKGPNGNRDSETNNGDLIADAMLWQVLQNKEGLTVDNDMVVAITNGGGIRAAIEPGDVTKNDINTVLPFGNTVALVYVTGAELLEALEASTFCTPEFAGGFPQIAGMELTIDTTKAYDANPETYPDSTYYGPASINRVTINSINGKAFDPEATYAVITNNFCAAGGDTYYAFAAASAQFDTGIPMDEAVMSYVTEELGGVIGEQYAEPQGRITVKGINPFADVAEDAYYKDAVVWARDNDITTGKSAAAFDPNGNVTRQEAITFIYRYAKTLGEGFTGSWMFPLTYADAADIADWANEAAHYAQMKQIAKGDENACFMPFNNITRQDTAVMLNRFVEAVGGDVEVDPETNYLSFGDLPEVSEYALHAIVWAQDKDIMNGDDAGNMLPLNNCTRAEFVTMLYRLANAD